MELISTSVSRRTKWDRSKGKKLSKKIWVARCIYLDENGDKREKTKEARTEAEAKDFQREFETTFKRSGGREIEAVRMTFNDLADFYEKQYAKPAEYVGERKVAGLRSLASTKTYLQILRLHFGKRKIKNITYSHISDFRALRLATPVEKKINRIERRIDHNGTIRWIKKKEKITSERKIASVNRELALLRRILNVACTQGWIPNNPFNAGNSLISTADETKRQRILSLEEEEKLLDVAGSLYTGWYLKPIIICALDTGMRLGEILKLNWEDIDFNNDIIKVKAFNTKTATPKTVPLTLRLRQALTHVFYVRLNFERKIDSKELYRIIKDKSPSTLDYIASIIQQDKSEIDGVLVFGIKNNIKRSWKLAVWRADLSDFRFHDLRHTTGTRLDQKGFSQAAIARVLGHQQISTTYRYINSDTEGLQRVKRALESFYPSTNSVEMPKNND